MRRPCLSRPGKTFYTVGGSTSFQDLTSAGPPSDAEYVVAGDRAWFVATEIDFDSTLVGCTRACATALLASELEVMEVSAETRLDIDGDTVNVK